jgi:glycosyltransferase involved in cell wall biosynthesis
MSAKRGRTFTSTLVIPTLNEVDGVRAILPRIDRGWVNQIVVVDGGSTDGTIEVCREQDIRVHQQARKGMRHAYRELLPICTGDVWITFSPDGNSLPELIPQLLDKIEEGNDLVIASRYAPGAKSHDDDLVTAFGNWLFTATVNLLYGARYTDVMVIYRAFRRDVIFRLDLDRDESYATPERLFGTTISWEPLMSARAAKAGLKTAEIPGDEPPRIGGERKLQVLRWGAAYYFQFFSNRFFWKVPEAEGQILPMPAMHDARAKLRRAA